MDVDEFLRIDRSIEIKAPPERIWRALTNASELSAWFQVQIEGEIAPGKDLMMTTTHLPENQVSFTVRIVEMTPPRRFVWDWYSGMVDKTVDYSTEPRTTVTFTLAPSAGGTLLQVAETGFEEISIERRAKVYADNSGGWTEVLVWLQRYAEAN